MRLTYGRKGFPTVYSRLRAPARLQWSSEAFPRLPVLPAPGVPTIVPKEVMVYDSNGKAQGLNTLWLRRQTTKFNGVSYPVQAGATVVFSEEGKKQVKEMINYYMENARIIREGLEKAGYKVFGGVSAPYIWLKTPNKMDSWDFFDKLMKDANVVGTPGAGFGANGEGYLRLTAFGTRENTERAVERIRTRM